MMYLTSMNTPMSTLTIDQKMDFVETGYTQRGVNKAIFSYLLNNKIEPKSILDMPCGEGHFLKSFKQFFPKCEIHGQDLYTNPLPEIRDCFAKKDVKDWSLYENKKFDGIFSISGVMVHDNIEGFIKSSYDHLEQNGFLLITNDNILTIRDRISFLLLGRFRRFKNIFSENEGNWNLLKIQSLHMLLRRSKFKIESIQYTSIYPEDYLLLPIALILLPLHLLYLWSLKSDMPFKDRYAKFPLSAFLSRHYIIVARKS